MMQLLVAARYTPYDVRGLYIVFFKSIQDYFLSYSYLSKARPKIRANVSLQSRSDAYNTVLQIRMCELCVTLVYCYVNFNNAFVIKVTNGKET
ncbi:Uncharacterised protein [uncultured archaeon]|nr:Uncharacterised protein [uncultured archaeon]